MIVKQLKFLVPDPLNPFESIKDDELNLAWKGFSCDFQVLKTESDLKLLQNSLYLLNKKNVDDEYLYNLMWTRRFELISPALDCLLGLLTWVKVTVTMTIKTSLLQRLIRFDKMIEIEVV